MPISTKKRTALRKAETSEEPARKAPVSRRQSAKKSEAPNPLDVKYFKERKPEKFVAADFIADPKNFHPSYVEWLQSNLGVRLERLPEAAIRALSRGEVTPPIEITVMSTAYDRAAKKRVDAKEVSLTTRLLVRPPFADGKLCAVDAKHPVYIESFPARPKVQALSDEEYHEAVKDVQKGESLPADQLPTFTSEQTFALDAAGIDPDRLWANNFNPLTVTEKKALLDGEGVLVDGRIRARMGDKVYDLFTCGVVQMGVTQGGDVLTKFESYTPTAEDRREGMVVDLLGGRRRGNVELVFVETMPNGKWKTNLYGRPEKTEAAANIAEYGCSLGGVVGYEQGKDKTSRSMFYVTEMDGALIPRKMVWVADKGEDGKPVLTASGKEKGHYEVPGVIASGSKVFLRNASTKDHYVDLGEAISDYRAGKGVVVKDVQWKDFSGDGKAPKVTKYDAVIVPGLNGFARQLSPEKSQKLIAAREQAREARQAQSSKVVRRKSFSI